MVTQVLFHVLEHPELAGSKLEPAARGDVSYLHGLL